MTRGLTVVLILLFPCQILRVIINSLFIFAKLDARRVMSGCEGPWSDQLV